MHSTFYVLIVSFVGLAVAQESEKDGNVTYDGFFTEAWRNEFSDKQLSRQPRWKLADDQPTTDEYDVREYAPAWFVTSHTPCMDQVRATTDGYMQAYLYMNRRNSNYAKYELTYPIINKAEFDAERADKSNKVARVRCPDRFSVSFYLPHEVGNDDPYDNPPRGVVESIVIGEQRDTVRRFVYSYEDVHNKDSVGNCNRQASLLAVKLAADGRSFNAKSHYCAVYEPGESGKIGFEVWFDEI